MRLAVCIPNHGHGDLAAQPLLHAQQRCPYIDGDIELIKIGGSGLTQNHNLLLCEAVNRYRKGDITHALFMHSDVQPRDGDWLSILIEEYQRARADVLGCFIAMKGWIGITSTALDTDYWQPQRLTLHQIKRLPVTWTHFQHPRLLLNTGLMLMDLSRIAALDPPPCFRFENRIRVDENGNWGQDFLGEDWLFSRECHKRGLQLFVTRALHIDHLGEQMYPSSPAWGAPLDPGHVRADEEIEVIGARGERIRFDPRDDGQMDPPDELPAGWFSPVDVEMYRHIYHELVPNGGATAEVGCYRGRSLASVADIIRTKGLTVYCVDDFDVPLLADRADRLPAFMAMVRDAGLQEHVVVLNGDSLEGAQQVPNGSLDFVFIDADHTYPMVKRDLEAWQRKIKSGGWFGGHDYDNENSGVVMAVNERFPIGHRKLNTSIWLVAA